MHTQILDRLATELQANGYPAATAPIMEGSPVSQITVSLPQAQPLVLVGLFPGDLFQLSQADSAEAAEMEEVAEAFPDLLQLFIQFPVEFSAQTLPDLARLLMMFNWITPVGAFGIHERKKIVYYRQVLLCPSEGFEPGQVLETVNGMEYYASLRSERIRQIAVGEVALADWMQTLDETQTWDEELPGYDL